MQTAAAGNLTATVRLRYNARVKQVKQPHARVTLATRANKKLTHATATTTATVLLMTANARTKKAFSETSSAVSDSKNHTFKNKKPELSGSGFLLSDYYKIPHIFLQNI